MADGQDEETGEISQRPQRTSVPKDIPSRTTNSDGSPHSPFLGAAAMFPNGVPASPPSFLSFEQLLKATEDVSKSEMDMALAHAIAINKDFKLEPNDPPKAGLAGKIAEMFHNAFWDILSQQLSSDPPEYTQALSLLKEIKEILPTVLLSHNTRLKNEIDEVLDLELIQQQVKNGTIDVLSYAQFIISAMSRVCAPCRDSNIQNLRQLTEVVPLYRGILETLDLMKLDMVNFTISTARPHIQQHSVEYEQKKFKEILQCLQSLVPPVDGLKFTRLWLKSAYDELVSEGNGEMPSNAAVLRRAYVNILRWKEADNFPETLHLDHERFINLKDKLTVLALTASAILVTFSNVGPSIQDIRDFKNTLKEHVLILLADVLQCSATELEVKMESVGLQVSKETNECLKTHGYDILTKDQEALLISAIKNLADENHTVRHLITKRMLEFLELALHTTSNMKIPPAKRMLEFLEFALHTTSNMKIPPGMSSLQNELLSFFGQFFGLVKRNEAVFGEYYNEIIDQKKSLNLD